MLIIRDYTIKHAQEFSYNFVQNWFVNQDYLLHNFLSGRYNTRERHFPKYDCGSLECQIESDIKNDAFRDAV